MHPYLPKKNKDVSDFLLQWFKRFGQYFYARLSCILRQDPRETQIKYFYQYHRIKRAAGAQWIKVK